LCDRTPVPNFMNLSLRPERLLIVALAARPGFVGRLLRVRSGDQPAWIAPDFRATKVKLIGCLAAIAAVATLESFVIASLWRQPR
jgi:uncharacterized membrane protein YqhA